MSPPDPLTAAEDQRALAELNRWLEGQSAEARVDWALANCAGAHVLSTSFGAQSAVALHLLTRKQPEIPVLLIDTGYLFPETYQFADELRERLQLNLQVYRPRMSAAWMEARYGRLWEHGIDGIERYNRLRKVEPMQRALDELGARTWFSGLRRSQSGSRAATPIVELKRGRWKVHPIADWNDRQVGRYMAEHDLPYHPLWEQGYVSIGDVHTTRPLGAGMADEDTRFFGLKRECGIHVEV
jgi:phosphoadenosine phosphosulfate reductase